MYKRGANWWVHFTSPKGERIRRSARTQNKKQAQEFEDRLKAELWRVEQLGDKPRRTWQEAVVRWLSNTEHKADHNKDIAKLCWLDGFLADLYLDEIDRDVIDHIAEKKRSEASASTANRYLAVIRAILIMARDEWDWIDKAPKIRLYKEPKKRVRWITQDQARTLLSELPTHLADMAEFSLNTGLRQSNVSYLKWDQISLERQLAWIHAEDSKNSKALTVPLNRGAMSVLARRAGINEVYAFTFHDQPLHRTSTKAWTNALNRAGITDFRWHDLRHTWASWHVQKGTSLQELMELGGWSSYQMVLRYAHLAGDHLREVANRLDDTKLSQPANSETEE
ncbi:tyrosine-type recombinase/integrase [Granulosicoccus antarcticus]|uniref:tyrosine-type recombinase/integrase n=1 Tax=Granulosicoccus antarcticus TaxID=437505 RepID=UPI003AB057D0